MVSAATGPVDPADFEHPDILELGGLPGLRAVIGPEPDGTVGADLDHPGSYVQMTPAEARQLAAALVKAADAAEHITA